MTDSPKQPDQRLATKKPDERLSARATEPPGVIDVRYAQQKYFRIAGWLDKRSALLDHLMSRYGIEEATANGERTLAMPRAAGQQLNLSSTTFQSFSRSTHTQAAVADRSHHQDTPRNQAAHPTQPSSLAQVIIERSLNQAASPEMKFRISRRPPATLIKPDAAPQITPRSGSVSATGQPSRDGGERAAGVNAAPNLNQTPPDPVFRDMVFTETGAEDPGVEKADTVSSTRAQEKPGPSARADEQAGAGRQVASGPTASALLLVKPLVIKPIVIGSAAVLPGLSPSNIGPSLLLHSAALLQSAAHASRSDEVAAQNHISSSQVSGVDRSAVVATEIRERSLNPERPDIVWRKRHDGRQAAAFTAQVSLPGATLSGAAKSGAVKSGSAQSSNRDFAPAPFTGEPASAPVKAETGRREVGVEQISPQLIRSISERVIRAITLDIKLERERRGVTRWR